MKTKQQNKQEKKNGGSPNFGSELQSRSEQVSGNKNSQTETAKAAEKNQTPAPPAPEPKPARVLPYVNFQQREENRSLSTDKVLDLLRRWLPKQYELAEVVGKWVWITFPEQPAEQVRGQLSQFGFHWNNTRKCWQHPCGQFKTEGSAQDPREKYATYFPADQVAA
jgi:hypothetical protein